MLPTALTIPSYLQRIPALEQGFEYPKTQLSYPLVLVEVYFSTYEFLTIGNLHKLKPEDVNYLEAERCLHVPIKPVLDRLFRHYFLFVHTGLPIINEGEFWDMYSSGIKRQHSRSKVAARKLYPCCCFILFSSLLVL